MRSDKIVFFVNSSLPFTLGFIEKKNTSTVGRNDQSFYLIFPLFSWFAKKICGRFLFSHQLICLHYHKSLTQVILVFNIFPDEAFVNNHVQFRFYFIFYLYILYDPYNITFFFVYFWEKKWSFSCFDTSHLSHFKSARLRFK